MKHLKLAPLAFPLALAACDAIAGPFSYDCTSIALPAISVTVVDSATGADLSLGATVRVRDGAVADSVIAPSDTVGIPPHPIGLAYERAGVYEVAVSHRGYRDWNASNVRVTEDRCHVRTVIVTARLVRLP